VRAATARHIKSNSLAPTLVVILLRALNFEVCIAVLVPWPGVVLDCVEDEVLVALTVAGFAAPTAVLQYAVQTETALLTSVVSAMHKLETQVDMKLRAIEEISGRQKHEFWYVNSWTGHCNLLTLRIGLFLGSAYTSR
jgi:hypothetical protein